MVKWGIYDLQDCSYLYYLEIILCMYIMNRIHIYSHLTRLNAKLWLNNVWKRRSKAYVSLQVWLEAETEARFIQDQFGFRSVNLETFVWSEKRQMPQGHTEIFHHQVWMSFDCQWWNDLCSQLARIRFPILTTPGPRGQVSLEIRRAAGADRFLRCSTFSAYQMPEWDSVEFSRALTVFRCICVNQGAFDSSQLCR